MPGEKEQASNNVKERGFIMFGMGLLFFSFCCCFSLDFSCGFL